MFPKACLLILGLLTMSTSTLAHDYDHDGLTIGHPWSRPTPPGTPVGVAYMTIRNQGAEPVTLIAATTPAAARVSIHQTLMQDGLMKMRPLEDGLTVPAGETVTLEPHSYHLMLEQLDQPLREGDEVPLSLRFEGMPPVQVKLHVEKLDPEPAMEHSDGHRGH